MFEEIDNIQSDDTGKSFDEFIESEPLTQSREENWHNNIIPEESI